MPVGLQKFFTEYATNWPGLMAASFIMSVPVVVLFLVLAELLRPGADGRRGQALSRSCQLSVSASSGVVSSHSEESRVRAVADS